VKFPLQARIRKAAETPRKRRTTPASCPAGTLKIDGAK